MLKTWITRIAINKAIDFKRSRARRPEELVERGTVDRQAASLHADGMLAAAPRPAAEAVAIRREELRQVQVMVNELPDNYRDVVTAFYIEEKSYEQIAAETGLERKSVESKLYRARGWMKRHWRKEDFE
jgi:RNA polymerase sigma factor (sigma-70 family)